MPFGRDWCLRCSSPRSGDPGDRSNCTTVLHDAEMFPTADTSTNVEDARRLPRNPAAAFARCKARGARTATALGDNAPEATPGEPASSPPADQALLIFGVTGARG